MSEPQTVRLGKTEYVIVPKAEYLRLRAQAGIPTDAVDALEYAQASLGANLRKARKLSDLTQKQLADKLGVSQPMVSGTEGGRVQVSERYVKSVLKACGLPEDWNGTDTARKKKPSRRKA